MVLYYYHLTHNLKVVGSNPTLATNQLILSFFFLKIYFLGNLLSLVTRGRSKLCLSFWCLIDDQVISRQISFNR